MERRDFVHEILSQNFKQWGFALYQKSVYVHRDNMAFTRGLLQNYPEYTVHDIGRMPIDRKIYS
jgi:hypothetical protein